MKRNSERWDWWLRRTCFLSLVGSIEDAFKDWSSKSIGSASIGQAQRQSFSFFHSFSMIFYVFTVYRRVLGRPQTSRSTKLDCGPLVKMWLSRCGWFNGCGCCSELPLRGKSDNANETLLRRPCSTSFFLLSYELKLWTKVVGIVVAPVHTKDSFLVFFWHILSKVQMPGAERLFRVDIRTLKIFTRDSTCWVWVHVIQMCGKWWEKLLGAPCISLVERGNFTLNSDAFFVFFC